MKPCLKTREANTGRAMKDLSPATWRVMYSELDSLDASNYLIAIIRSKMSRGRWTSMKFTSRPAGRTSPTGRGTMRSYRAEAKLHFMGAIAVPGKAESIRSVESNPTQWIDANLTQHETGQHYSLHFVRDGSSAFRVSTETNELLLTGNFVDHNGIRGGRMRNSGQFNLVTRHSNAT